MGLDAAHLIPPPVELERFEQAAASVNGDRGGIVSVGSWRNLGKAPRRVAEWAAEHGGVDFYGDGPFAPDGSREVAYEDMPALLARYRDVRVPAAGDRAVRTPRRRSVGRGLRAGRQRARRRRYWIEHEPAAMRTAAADYWELILA